MFSRLADNIKQDSRLESLPLCHLEKDKIHLISGHHRVRAARSAGIDHIHILLITTALTRSEVISKQLSHNALSGFDDPQVISELFSEITDLSERVYAGLDPEEYDLGELTGSGAIDSLEIDWSFRLVQIMFLPSGLKKFKEAVEAMEGDEILLAMRHEHSDLVKALKKVSEMDDVRNLSAIFSRMSEIVLEHYAKDGKN